MDFKQASGIQKDHSGWCVKNILNKKKGGQGGKERKGKRTIKKLNIQQIRCHKAKPNV